MVNMMAAYQKYLLAFFVIISVCARPYQLPKRQMEYLDRGFIAVPDGKGNVFLSWRWLITDDEKTLFWIHRRENGGEPVVIGRIDNVTHWVDKNVDSTRTYTYELSEHIRKKA